jgi:hypothetical protein
MSIECWSEEEIKEHEDWELQRRKGAIEELESHLKWINNEIQWYLDWEKNNISNEYNITQRKCLERIKKRLIIKRLKELKKGVEK